MQKKFSVHINPVETLDRIGVTSGKRVVDIDCGDGLFTVAAAHLTKIGLVYAVDHNTEAIDYVHNHGRFMDLHNLITRHANASIQGQLRLAQNTIHFVFMIVILRCDKERWHNLFTETQQILEPTTGKVLIIESTTSSCGNGGASPSSTEVEYFAKEYGFVTTDRFLPHPNYWAIVLQKEEAVTTQKALRNKQKSINPPIENSSY